MKRKGNKVGEKEKRVKKRPEKPHLLKTKDRDSVKKFCRSIEKIIQLH